MNSSPTRVGGGRRWLAAAHLAGALLLAGCATNPITGQRELVLMSPQREAELGRQAAQQVEGEIGLVRDPGPAEIVEAIGQRLARLSPRQDVPYRFFVASMPEANAFALPGGYVYVSRGLLALANSEDELANVIGHEIGHVAARHAAQRETRALGVGLLSILGTVVAGAAGGQQAAQAAAQIGQVAGAGLIASYSRDQERQADEVGQELAAAAAWDPGAMASFLKALERDEELRRGEKRLPSFLDSHPVTAERIRDTRERATTLTRRPGAPVAATRAAFLDRFEGLLVGPDPAEGVFRENRFLHVGLDFGLDFPSGWQTANRKDAVGAIAPGEEAVVVIEIQEAPGDPRAAADRFAAAQKIGLAQRSALRIGGMAAHRARTTVQTAQGTVALDLTWIAHPAGVFRVTGMTVSSRFAVHAERFESTARSFHRLSPEERDRVRERRLHIVRAQRGETLDALSRRTGNRWEPEETAVANGLERGARLSEGQAIKIAIELPYLP